MVAEPVNLGDGWVGFDFEAAFGKPTQVVNDAVMQAVGSYQGGRMLFLGLGTGLGSAMIVDGVIEPLELGHLPYRKKTFEDYVGERGLEEARQEEVDEGRLRRRRAARGGDGARRGRPRGRRSRQARRAARRLPARRERERLPRRLPSLGSRLALTPLRDVDGSRTRRGACTRTVTKPLPTSSTEAGVGSHGGYYRSHPQAHRGRRRSVDQSRALLPRIRRAPARAGARRDPAAARAGLLPQGLGRDAGRVLHGPRRRADRPDQSRCEQAPARRPHAAADTRRRTRARARSVREPGRALEERALPGAGRGADRRLDRRGARAGGARRARRPLRARDLPRTDAAGRRARPAVSLHLRALDQPRPLRGRPRDRRGAPRQGQGAGGPASLLPRRRTQGPLRSARASALPLPARAVPGDGDPRAVRSSG